MEIWREMHPDYMREWKSRNAEEQRRYMEIWRKIHPDYMKEWNSRNAEKIRQYREIWIKKHPNYMEEWRRRNPEKIRQYSARQSVGASRSKPALLNVQPPLPRSKRIGT